MGRFDNVEGISRRVMTLFFVVDVSGSMTGDKIGTVNSTMEEIIPVIRDISAKNTDALIKVAVLKFSKGAQWVEQEGVNKPIDVREYEWQHLSASGVTDFGKACLELNKKMSRKEFMEEASGSYAPVIILLSDGEPTDDYRSGLAVLQQNNWYRSATKAAIAIGNDVNVTVLEEFTGKAENVVRVYDKDALKRWLEFITVTSSKIGSTSTNVIKNKNDALTDAIRIKQGEESGEIQKEDSFAPTVTETLSLEPQNIAGFGEEGEDADDFIW